MQQITLDEAQAQLLDLVDAAIAGEEVYIITHGDQVVQLVPVIPSTRGQSLAARGMITLADDFDAPLTDFVDINEISTLIRSVAPPGPTAWYRSLCDKLRDECALPLYSDPGRPCCQ